VHPEGRLRVNTEVGAGGEFEDAGAQAGAAYFYGQVIGRRIPSIPDIGGCETARVPFLAHGAGRIGVGEARSPRINLRCRRRLTGRAGFRLGSTPGQDQNRQDSQQNSHVVLLLCSTFATVHARTPSHNTLWAIDLGLKAQGSGQNP